MVKNPLRVGKAGCSRQGEPSAGENALPLPVITKLETVAQSALFGIEAMHLRFSNGVERVYERLRGGGREAVIVAAIDEHDRLV